MSGLGVAVLANGVRLLHLTAVFTLDQFWKCETDAGAALALTSSGPTTFW